MGNYQTSVTPTSAQVRLCVPKQSNCRPTGLDTHLIKLFVLCRNYDLDCLSCRGTCAGVWIYLNLSPASGEELVSCSWWDIFHIVAVASLLWFELSR